jgi:hypothetical protein
MNAHLEQLKETIELNYYCRAEHVASAGVIEMSGGETVWQGTVEVFNVTCYLPVKRCYAWSETRGPTITVLELPPVRSAGTAVRAVMASAGKQCGRPLRTSRPFAAEIDEKMFAFKYECSSISR